MLRQYFKLSFSPLAQLRSQKAARHQRLLWVKRPLDLHKND
jgi:hypothetical protein